MGKIDLKDVTFMIPLRTDTKDRLRNLTINISYLLEYFDTNIIILEEDKESQLPLIWRNEWNDSCSHIFVKSDNELFHHTKSINTMAKKTKTPVIVNHDLDALLPIPHYVEAAEFIRNNEYDFVYPHNWVQVNIREPYISLIEKTLSLDMVSVNRLYITNQDMIGGSVFMNKEKFTEAGMENENFIGWGHEDREHLVRFEKLGYRIHKLHGLWYHLHHRRTKTSWFTDPNAGNDNGKKYDYVLKNKDEKDKVVNMTVEELKEYIKTWNWL